MHHLKIRLYTRIPSNENFEYIELAQNHDQTYSWNIHDAFNDECLGQHHTALKDIEEKYKNRATKLNPNIWNERQSVNIYIQNKNNNITILNIGYLTVSVTHSNINDSRIILSLEDYNSGDAPHYNLNTIHTMPAQQAAEYILSHIHVNNLIQRFVQDFPHQHPHNTGMLHHYHEKLPPHIPCATSQIVNKNNNSACSCSFTQEILSIQMPSDQKYIRIGTNIDQSMINNNDPCINPDSPSNEIIPQLAQHIHESYMQHPDISTLSEHEKIRIHRVFHDHGHDIAHQVYHDSLLHRAARLQSPVFTFPRAEL